MQKQWTKLPQYIRNLAGVSGIMIIRHKESGQYFISTAKNLYTAYIRISNGGQHKKKAPILVAIDEEGWDAFTFDYELCDVGLLKIRAAELIEEYDSVENGYNKYRNPNRQDEYKNRNDPDALCSECGINKVETSYNGGNKYVYTKCHRCRVLSRKGYRRPANNKPVPVKPIPMKWYEKLWIFILDLFT